MSRAHAAWWGTVAALGVIDVMCDRRHDHSTASCAVRHTFRTDTPAGRVLLFAGWSALTAWFLPHLLRHELDAALDSIDLTNLTGEPRG